MLNLAELLSLRPDLQKLRKVIYFHENQLAYPSQSGCATADGQQDWGCKWGQIMSCLVADKIAFNSQYNRHSFLTAIPTLLNKIPKPGRPSGAEIVEQISAKSTVVYFPLLMPSLANLTIPSATSTPARSRASVAPAFATSQPPPRAHYVASDTTSHTQHHHRPRAAPSTSSGRTAGSTTRTRSCCSECCTSCARLGVRLPSAYWARVEPMPRPSSTLRPRYIAAV